MEKLIGKDMLKALTLFDEYTHSQPIVMSAFQEADSKWGAVYADDSATPKWALIYTPNMYFLAGDSKAHEICQKLERLLFDVLLEQESEKEMSIFTPSDAWFPVLDNVIASRKGFRIPRKQFVFQRDIFEKSFRSLPELPSGNEIRVMDAEMAASNPVLSALWTDLAAFVKSSCGACLYLGGTCVSTCTAPMVGGGYAEIDIGTHPHHQGKGYGTLVAARVIKDLLLKGLTPTWSTWPNREASQAVARKLGFIPQPDIVAYHWNQYECV